MGQMIDFWLVITMIGLILWRSFDKRVPKGILYFHIVLNMISTSVIIAMNFDVEVLAAGFLEFLSYLILFLYVRQETTG